MIVIVDIDDTLADASWRAHHIPDWDAFHGSAHADEPIKAVVEVVNGLNSSGYEIVAITGRDEKWRAMTLEWLSDYDIMVDDLYMRPDGDYSRSRDLKTRIVKEICDDPRREILLAIDDHEDVCEAYRSLGIPTLIARHHNFVERK